MDDNDGEVLYECGVDLNSDLSFIDGDIKLSMYEDNLIQAVINRLNTTLDELDLFYEDYGTILRDFLGWKAEDDTLDFIKSEVDNVLLNDPRVMAHESEVSYTGEGTVNIDVVLYTVNGSVDANLVLGSTGVVELDEDEVNIEEE